MGQDARKQLGGFEMSGQVVPKWRLSLAGGALVLLVALGFGAVNARSPAATVSDDPGVAAASTELASGPTAGGAGDAALLRPRRLGRALVHGTVTLDLPQKGLVTVQVDHGNISSVGANNVAISEAGGSTVTVATAEKTRVRKNGEKVKLSDLKAGDEVFVVSELEGGKATAYRIVVPKAAR
jgi:hypothetical protein